MPDNRFDLQPGTRSDTSGVRRAVRPSDAPDADRPSVTLFQRWELQSVEEIYADELEEAADLEATVPAMPMPSRTRRTVLLFLVSLVLLASVGLLGVAMLRMGSPERAPAEAQSSPPTEE